MKNTTNPIELKLKLEALRRTHSGAILQLGLFFVLFLWLKNDILRDTFLTGCTILVFGVLLFRLAAFKINKNHANSMKYFKTYMNLICINGMLYGFMCGYSIAQSQYFSTSVMLLFYFIMGIMTAAISNLSPVPYYQRFYTLCVSAPILAAALHPDMDYTFRSAAVLYTIYLVYMLSISRVINKDLLSSYLNEYESNQKSEHLKYVIDLVPGFVGLRDQYNQWTATSQSFESFSKNTLFKEELERFTKSEALQLTKVISWEENLIGFSYIVSFQKNFDQSIVTVGIEASELMSVKKELEIQRAKAEHASRLATLGEMAGGIAHEVNNPLAVVVGLCDQIQKSIKSENFDRLKASDQIERISKTSFRISKIVAGLKRFSRQSENEEFVYTPFSQILEETLDLCREKLLNKGIELEIADVPNVDLPVRSVQINQVMVNLINNAFDAVSDLETKKISLHFSRTDDFFTMHVSDSGPGISSVILPKIFNPFFTTKDVGQGTGLGLSISRSIILDHQGDLQVTSLNEPTTFSLSLPFHRSDKAVLKWAA